MLTSEIMSRPVITASPNISYHEAVDLLRKHNIHHLPVLDHSRLVGIVVQKDLLSAQPSKATTLSRHEIYGLLEKVTLRQLMSSPVFTVPENCPVWAATWAMMDLQIGCLPVVRGAELVGIITQTDVFKTLVKVLDGGRPGMRFSVRLPNTPDKLVQINNLVRQAGSDVVNVMVWPLENGQYSELTIKERDADGDKLRALLTQAGAELLDMRQDDYCDVREFGGE